MNCPNCGAAMHLVDRRTYFVCDYCATFCFPEEEPCTDDGVQVLGETSEVLCPVCEEPLVAGAIDEIRVLHCRECRGVLVGHENFAAIVRTRRAGYTGDRTPPRPIDPEELERTLHCPTCNQILDTHPYYGPGNVVIDTCGRCCHIWLDHGELALIEKAPGR